MAGHLLRALWRRRHKNGLIIVEIFISFVVLFTILVSATQLAQLWLKPLGFEYENIWSVDFTGGGVGWTEEDRDRVRRLLQVTRQLDEVEAAEGLSMKPFYNGRWITTMETDEGQTSRVMINLASDGFREMVGMKLVAGRWFGREDDGVSWRPVVVNQQFVDELIPPGVDPIGEVVGEDEPEDGRKQQRVIGVVEDFRQMGELKPSTAYMFWRFPETGEDAGEEIYSFHVKVRPGTSSAFEEKLLETMRSVAPTWQYRIRTWEANRESMIREALGPLLIGGIAGGALLLMVALGLLGVLWQSVTARTVEFGLRRAVGAAARRIYRQVTWELMLLVTLGSIAGSIVAVQLPMLGVISWVDWTATWYGLGATLVSMVGIALACAAYPSWLAMKVQPAEALHYE